MTARGKAHTSESRRSAPRTRPRRTSVTAPLSSGAAEILFLKTRIGRDWNTLLRRLRRWRKRLRTARCKLNPVPPAVRAVAIAAVALGVFSMMNFVYHVVRKPTEMLFPVSGALNKMPAETWRQYAPLFNEYSTANITPELLAALAQVESAGNPVARTYWRWRLTWHPFEIYQPASSAVGMYQLTDAAFDDARHYCIRHHAVVEEGAWNDWRSCWFNRFYSRLVPSHAIELTAVSLDRNVAEILARRPNAVASLQQTQDLAAIVHLCGAGPAAVFARSGFKLMPGERCGDHDVAVYLARVNAMKRQFRHLAAER
jgi:Transglycosylase SLT domain